MLSSTGPVSMMMRSFRRRENIIERSPRLVCSITTGIIHFSFSCRIFLVLRLNTELLYPLVKKVKFCSIL